MRSSVLCTWPVQKNDVLSALVNDCRFGGWREETNGNPKGASPDSRGVAALGSGRELGLRYDEAGNNRDLFRHLVVRCQALLLFLR